MSENYEGSIISFKKNELEIPIKNISHVNCGEFMYKVIVFSENETDICFKLGERVQGVNYENN